MWWHVLVIFPPELLHKFPLLSELRESTKRLPLWYLTLLMLCTTRKLKKGEQIFSWKPLPPNNGLCCYGFFLENMVWRRSASHSNTIKDFQVYSSAFKVYNRTWTGHKEHLLLFFLLLRPTQKSWVWPRKWGKKCQDKRATGAKLIFPLKLMVRQSRL